MDVQVMVEAGHPFKMGVRQVLSIRRKETASSPAGRAEVPGSARRLFLVKQPPCRFTSRRAHAITAAGSDFPDT
jgi:hypothetical protein